MNGLLPSCFKLQKLNKFLLTNQQNFAKRPNQRAFGRSIQALLRVFPSPPHRKNTEKGLNFLSFGFKGTLDALLDSLNGIRLAQLVEYTRSKGRPKVIYKLEEMSEEQQTLVKIFNLSEVHLRPIKIDGVRVYSQKLA